MMLPARGFATAWLNTSLASGTDEHRPQLYRTLLVEVFDRAVRLVAADGVMLLTSTVKVDEDDLDVADAAVAGETHVVIDHDGRMRNLMSWVLRDAVAADKNGIPPTQVTVEVRSGERPSMPTLSSDLDRQVMVVGSDREQLDLDLYGGPYVDWQQLFAGRNLTPTQRVAFSPAMLGRFGKLRDLVHPVVFHLAGPDGSAQFEIDCEPSILGLLMTCRVQ
jgi:hypothetical protein